ncbi:hypothetical protein ATL41_1181 [Flavimobilis soli]|uniref:Uncharacterized protein n=1 Tax=Flavimobilis soli TaxID=442709 RepID=A0A2A9EDV7_9MICO|nr:hypothetical protein [Flavimobilis soli]PFG36455.1 hypothetical protein ATL41_1181 [Flavimobilis soli]
MADGDRDKDDATQEGADRPADQPGETGLPGADPSASTRPDGPTPPPDAARPRDLWAGVPRREVSRPDGPRTDERTGAPQAGAALSASFPERAADEPRTITEPPSPALHLDTPDPAGAATPSDGADRPGRGRRTLLLVGVPVVVVALVAAFVLPKVLGDDTPQVPRLGRPTAAADVDASALLPGLVFGEDKAADLPLPPALDEPAEAPSGVDERWRLSPEDLIDIWHDAGAAGTGATKPSLVVARPAVAGAAYEANVSDVVPVVLEAYLAGGAVTQTNLLVGLDAEDGSVLWTWPFASIMPNSCQSIGRGANVACVSAGDSDDEPQFTVTVLEAADGREAATFTTSTCVPTSFLQQGTRLYWAGVSLERMEACLGGGTEHFATLTDGGFVDSYTDWLTMTPTGPLLRVPGASVMLTEDGWRGYRGRVEPGPGGLIVREITQTDADATRFDPEQGPGVSSYVSTIDGETVMWAKGASWRRLDLVPEASGPSDFTDVVGIGGNIYDPLLSSATAGDRPDHVVSTIPGVDDLSIEYGGSVPPRVTPAGVVTFATVEGGVGATTTQRWTAEAVREGVPAETHEQARSFATFVGRTTLSYEGGRESIGEHTLGQTHLAERTLVVEQEDGATDRFDFAQLYALTVEDTGADLDLGVATSPLVVVGPMIVLSDDGGLVAVS